MRLYSRRWGTSGPQVVLVHGHVVSSRYMVPLGEALGACCQVIAPDLPGSGRSEKPRQTLDIPQLADALHRVIVEAGFHRPVLIGNSMGCQIICNLLSRVDCASRVVLQAPTMDADARKVHVQLGRFFHSAIHEEKLLPLAAIYLWDLWRTGPINGWRSLQFALNDRIEDSAARVHVPALIVRGEHDFIVPEGWARRLAGVMPKGQFLTLCGVAHGVHYSATQRFVEAILPFVVSQE